LIQEDAQRELANAKPVLRAAGAALKTIKPGDIVELTTIKEINDLIKRIFDRILILLKKKVDYYVTKVGGKEGATFDSLEASLMQAPSIMNGYLFGILMNYPLESINEEMRDLLKPYTSMPDFNPVNVLRVSKATEGLRK
jgi:dynein heavy chain